MERATYSFFQNTLSRVYGAAAAAPYVRRKCTAFSPDTPIYQESYFFITDSDISILL